MIRKIATALLGVLGLGFAVSLALVLCLLFAPQVLVNTRTVTAAVRYFYPEEQLSWRVASVQVDSQSAFEKRLVWRLEQAKVNTSQIKGQVAVAKGEALVDLNLRRPFIKSIGPLVVDKLNLSVTRPEAEEGMDPAEESSPLNRVLPLLNQLGRYRFRNVQVSVVALQVKQGERVFSGRGNLHYEDAANGLDKTFRLLAEDIKGAPLRELKSEGLIAFESVGTPAEIKARKLDFKVDARLSQGAALTAELQALPVEGNGMWDVRGRTKFLQGKSQAQAEIDGFVDEHQLLLEVVGEARHMLPYFRAFRAKSCQIKANWKSNYTDDLRGSLACQGEAERWELTDEPMIRRFLPTRFGMHLTGDLRTEGKGDQQQIVAAAKLVMERVEGSTLALAGFGEVAGRLPLARPAQGSFKASYDFEAHIKKFEGLVTDLRDSHWAIPAPFNQLAGEAGCRSQGDFNFATKHGNIPLQCEVSLQAEPQRLIVNTTGRLELRSSGGRIHPQLNLKVDLERFDLVLPKIELGKQFPRLFTDKRLRQDKDKAKPAKTTMGYHVEIVSRHKDSIHIHSNLLSKPLPLSLSAVLQDNEPPQGKVRVDEYHVEFLRRKIEVKRFEMDLHSEPKRQYISGLVRFQDNIYRIFMKVYGSTAEPVFTFSSEPPLPERDILAIVLFGSKPDSLDAERMSSVDETRAALADGAISLLSMYFLAATPVESIGYNPESQMFTANIKLREGLSLSLGTDADNRNQFGLKKRLGRNTTVETRVIHDEATDENKGAAMLKWGIRY